jgi:hypothetical protein
MGCSAWPPSSTSRCAPASTPCWLSLSLRNSLNHFHTLTAEERELLVKGSGWVH